MQLIWEEFLKIIKENAGSQVVETWFKAVSLEKWDPKTQIARLKTPNQFVSKWLQEHYHNLITTNLCRLLNSNQISLTFTCSTTPINNKNIIPASIIYDKDKPNFTDPEKKNEIKTRMNKKGG